MKGDVPVEDRAKLHERVARLGVLPTFGAHRLTSDLKLIDLAKPRRDRPHLRGAVSCRNGLSRFGEALGDKLAREVDIGAFLEHDRDGRQTKT